MDNNNLNSQEVLDKLREILKQEGLDSAYKADEDTLISEYILPALDELKEIQASLHEPFYSASGGLKRKIKNKLISKIANITRNTVELSLMRQQKFNDNVSLILTYLFKENKKLKKELEEIKRG